VNIEGLLPSARPKFTQYSFEVIKPGSLWRLKVEQSSSLQFKDSAILHWKDKTVGNSWRKAPDREVPAK
jgi:hypothetical protein